MAIPVALTKLVPHPKNGQLPPVDAATYTAMKADIVEHGILHPVTVNARTWHIVMGHHRVQIAQELGWTAIPADLIDVDSAEEERLMITDNILRRQIDKPMDKARLIRWLKELHGVKQGKNNSSLKFNEEARRSGVAEATLRNLDKLNDLIPPLQAMVDNEQLLQSVGTDLARKFTPEQQQDLYDILGPEGMSRIKPADIQQAKREAAPSHTESEIQAILGRVKELQAQKNALEQRLATVEDQPDPDPDLLDRLETAETEREALEEEVTRLRNQPPTVVEKLVEKLVPVDQPDPAQVARMAELSQSLETTQAELTLLKTRRKDLLHYEQERDRLQAEAAGIKNELARLRDSTNVARYRLAQAVDIAAILRKILDQGLADVPKLEALLADSEGAILPTDRELARNVAEQLQRASDLILTAVRQFTTPVITPTDPFDPNDSTIQLLKEAHVLDDDHSIITPGD